MWATHLVSETVCGGAVVVRVSLGSVSVDVSLRVVEMVVRRSVIYVRFCVSVLS
jgi:hypothetical protein